MKKNKNKFNIAFIGGGMMAQVAHIPFYLKNKNCEISYICESRPSIVTHLSKTVPQAKIISDYYQIFEDSKIDAVIISIPRAATSYITSEVLKNNLHVLAEKPMAYTLNQAKKLSKLAIDNNLIYSIGYMKRYDIGIKYAKFLLEKFQMKKIYGNLLSARFYNHSKSYIFSPPNHQRPIESRHIRFKEWATCPSWIPKLYKNSYDWFMNSCSHDINLLSYFFDSETFDIKNCIYTNENSLSALLTANNVNIMLDFASSSSGEWTEGIDFVFENCKLEIKIPSPMDINHASNIYLSEKNKPKKNIFIKNSVWSFEEQAHAFIKCLEYKDTPATSGNDAYNDLKIVQNIWRKLIE